MLTMAIVGNFVGDYLVQNDWMALNKKKAWLPLVVHCGLWTFSVMLFSGTTDWRIAAILFITHAIQDGTDIIRWWMFRIGQKEFATGPLSPWSIIVVDNVWHIITITIVWRLFGLSSH